MELSFRPLVVLVLRLVSDLRDLFFWEEGEQFPSLVQGVEDGPVLLEVLSDELGLELVVKLQVCLILGGQGVLTDDGLHSLRILALGVERVHLVGDLWMISSGETFTDSVLHQTRQRWQHVDWWVDTSSEHASVDVDLTLSDIASQIGDWMRDIVIGHSQDWNLCDGSVLALDTTSTLVDGGKIGVHITWVTSTTRHLLSCSGDLTQGVGVGGHIGEDGQHVHVLLVRQVLGGGQRESRGDNTLDGRVVRVVHEKHDTVHGSVDLEFVLEETSSLQVDTHSSENDTEVLLGVVEHVLLLDEGGLTADLSTDLVVWETGGGEQWNLLPSGNGGHGVDGGDTRLDHFLRVHSRAWVDWLTLDIEELLCEHWGSVVDWVTGSIEGSTKHFNAHWHPEYVTGELASRGHVVDIGGTLENLYNSLLALDLQHLSLSHYSISQSNIDNLGILGELDVLEDDEGSVDILDGSVVDSGSDVVVSGGGQEVFL